MRVGKGEGCGMLFVVDGHRYRHGWQAEIVQFRVLGLVAVGGAKDEEIGMCRGTGCNAYLVSAGLVEVGSL